MGSTALGGLRRGFPGAEHLGRLSLEDRSSLWWVFHSARLLPSLLSADKANSEHHVLRMISNKLAQSCEMFKLHFRHLSF